MIVRKKDGLKGVIEKEMESLKEYYSNSPQRQVLVLPNSSQSGLMKEGESRGERKRDEGETHQTSISSYPHLSTIFECSENLESSPITPEYETKLEVVTTLCS